MASTDTLTGVPGVSICSQCGRSSPASARDCAYCGMKLVESNTLAMAPTLIHADPQLPPRAMPEPAQRYTSDPLIGQDLDKFRIDAFLGRGGMGRVYLAHHRDLHRPCALKVLLPELASDDQDYVRRFMNEGRAAASLVHPNIVTIHSCGQAEGYYYLEMEFVAGRSMRQLIHDEVRLTPVRATGLAAKVAEALAVAHRDQIVHQDLKPDNVLLTLQGVPKLADFGLAKRLKDASGGPSGALSGTPHYMAPELFQGQPANPASDVYALGVTYFLALTGRFPFHADSLIGLVDEVTTRPVPDLRSVIPDVSLDVAECVARMLDKTPANRPQNALEAAMLLNAVLGEVRDLDTLMNEAFRDDPSVQVLREGPRYRLLVSLPDGRRQTVFVEPSDHAVADRLLMITSICCRTVPNYFEQALRLNSEIPHGSIAIRTLDGVPMFVVMDTYPRATVDAVEVHKSVLSVATRADMIELILTGSDRN